MARVNGKRLQRQKVRNATPTRDTMNMIRRMAGEFSNGKVETFTRVNTSMMNVTASARWIGQMGVPIRVSGLMGYKVALD